MVGLCSSFETRKQPAYGDTLLIDDKDWQRLLRSEKLVQRPILF